LIETMKIATRAPRGVAVMLVSLAAGVGVAACGSSSNTTSSKNASSTSTTKSTGRAAFEACLKDHGVSLPKRRSGGFGGGRPQTGTNGAFTRPAGGAAFPAGGGGFTGANRDSKLAKAFKACSSKLGKSGFGGGAGFGRGFRGGGPAGGSGPARTHFTAATLKSFVACVRQNGYAAMPEANANGKFPKRVESSSKFQAAARKCFHILFQQASGTSTTTSTA
jgi:hypothetical protein